MSETPPARRYNARDVIQNRPLVLALGVALAGLCLLVVFMALLLRGDGPPPISSNPTPFPPAGAGGVGDVIIAGVSNAGAVSLTVNAPASLQIGAQSFTVRSEEVQADGRWNPQEVEGNTAVWVYGTLINYVLGLPESEFNRTLLESLSPGDNLFLRLRDGGELPFAVTNREVIAANRSDVFAQNTPGLTLLMLRERGDERLVVQAAYVGDPAAVSSETGAGGGAVELGEAAQLDNVRITTENATALYDQAQAPPGFIFYVVDFRIENVGAEALDMTRFRFTLRDSLGNQYASNTQAAGFGAYGPLAGVLLPGEGRQASVGYQVPQGLSSPTLTWQVMREGSTNQVEVVIPFAASSVADAVGAEVNLQSGSVSADGAGLLLSGQISNNGSQPLVVNESNVSLRSDGTVHLMLSTNPAFPWVVPPGQTLNFTVSFQRPAESQALFTLLDRPFELTGLR